MQYTDVRIYRIICRKCQLTGIKIRAIVITFSDLEK